MMGSRIFISALLLCACLFVGAGCFRVTNGSGTRTIKFAGGVKSGLVETAGRPLMYSVTVSIVEQETARRIAFENLAKASILLVPEDYEKLWKGTALKGGKLEIKTVSGTFGADLKPDVVYFVDIKRQRVIPLRGVITEADFDEADALKRKMESIAALNAEVLNADR